MFGAARGIPNKARVGALLFLVVGGAVLLSVLIRVSGPEAGGIGVAGPLVRGLGLILIAWGLLVGAGWAWLLGTIFPALWVVMGVVGLARSDFSAGWIGSWIAAIVALLALAGGVALLLSPEVRRTYRGGDRPPGS